MPYDDSLLGVDVLDARGVLLGRVSALLVEPDHKDARWIDLTTADGEHVVIPVQVASADAAGRLVIPYGPADLAGAPKLSGQVMSSAAAAELLTYYGFAPESG